MQKDCSEEKNTKNQEILNKLVKASMTPEEEAEFLEKCIEEEREITRQALKEIRKKELREQARQKVSGELKQGYLPPKPPQKWEAFVQENMGNAFHAVHNFAVGYVTLENAAYGVGAAGCVAAAATKKGVAIAAAVTNPIVAGAGAALLVSYGIHQYNHRNDTAPAASTPDEAELGHQRYCSIM